MKEKSLPTCEDFIIGAIRKIRKNAVNTKKDVPKGLELCNLYECIALSPYQDEEYAEAMRKLLANGTLLLASKFGLNDSRRSQRNSYKALHHSDINKNFLFNFSGYTAMIDGNLFSFQEHKILSKYIKTEDFKEIYEQHVHLLVYVIADGLTKKVEKILQASRGVIEKDVKAILLNLKHCSI